MTNVAPHSQNIDPSNTGGGGTHPSADELEFYSLGMIQHGGHLAQLEEHLLICVDCVDRAIKIEDWVRTMKKALSIEPEWMSDADRKEPS